jgi:hypothetical protein
MSTKIYDAYVIEKEFTLLELQGILLDYRKKVLQRAQEDYMEILVNLCTSLYDDLSIGLDVLDEYKKGRYSKLSKDTDSIKWVIFEYLNDRFRATYKTHERDPICDWELNISIVPLEGKTIFKLFTEKKFFKEMWKEIDGVKDYHYQDQTDPPEDISEEEWDQRRKDWEKVFEKVEGWAFSSVAYNFDFINAENASWMWMAPANEVLLQKHISSHEDRSRGRAWVSLSNKLFAEEKKKWKEENPDIDTDTEEGKKQLKRAVSWYEMSVKAEEDKEGIEKEVNRFKSLLNKDLKISDFTKTVKEVLEKGKINIQTTPNNTDGLTNKVKG